jgi:hypothetical protein
VLELRESRKRDSRKPQIAHLSPPRHNSTTATIEAGGMATIALVVRIIDLVLAIARVVEMLALLC